MPSPILVSTAETVECGILRHSAISAPVIRNRRNAAIATTPHELGRTAKNFGSFVSRERAHRLPSGVSSCESPI